MADTLSFTAKVDLVNSLKVREIFGCFLGEDTCVNGSHRGFFSLL